MSSIPIPLLLLLLLSTIFVPLRELIYKKAAKDFMAFLAGTPVFIEDDDETSLSDLFDFENLDDFLSDEIQANPYLHNVCINNKDPKKMSPREQLLEFVQGPCVPVVLIPGLIASKLNINIDCETLKSQSPDIFSTCGWNTCEDSWNPLKKAPKKSYSLWISDFQGPLSLIWSGSVSCWSSMIQLKRDSAEADITKRYKTPPGVTVSFYTSSVNEGKCGLAAQENLLDSRFQIADSKAYYAMKTALIAMGYQVGLSLYGAPYDWRKTTLANGISSALHDTLIQAYNLTGKPSILIAHSLGNFGALNMLNSLSQEEKDKYVFNYITIANALNGSPKTIISYIGGDPEYYFWNRFGLNYAAQMKLLDGSSGTSDLLYKDPFNTFKGQEWLNDWHERVKMEADHDITTPEGKKAWEEIVSNGKYSYRWFPTPLTQCFSGFKYRPDNCGLFSYDWGTEPIITVQGKAYTGSEQDIKSLMELYSPVKDVEGMLADSKTNNIYKLENPGVPITVIYGSHLPTYKSFTFDYDPKSFTDKGEYAPMNSTKYIQGDGTVPTASGLMSAFKWSWEFDNKEKAGLPHAKPVKTVEVCSINNNKESIYDKPDSHEVTSNEYIGVRCDCIPKEGKTTDGAACTHSGYISDTNVIKFIQNIANAKAPNSKPEETGAFKMTDDELRQKVDSCPVAGVPRSSEHSNLMKERAELLSI